MLTTWTDDQLADVLARLRKYEGCIPWMYQDTGGEVTTGIGELLPSVSYALTIPWHVDGRAALATEVTIDFHTVENAEHGHVASYYANLTKCRLDESDITGLVRGQIRQKLIELRAAIGWWDQLPASVQEAVFDMGYNLGVNKLVTTYPRLMNALRAGDWVTAAGECHRGGIGQDRNEETARLIRSAAISSNVP